MSTPSTRIAGVITAERAGGGRPSEDRIFIAPQALIVLDGATQPDAGDKDGGWLAERLGRQLHRVLQHERRIDLEPAVAHSIEAITRTHGLSPGSAPSSTVSIARWNEEFVEAYVLGDTPIFALRFDGTVVKVRDDRLGSIAVEERRALIQSSTARKSSRVSYRQQLVAAEREARNRPDGYWIAETDPMAARHAVRVQWKRDDIAAVMALTDGVADAIDSYGLYSNWGEVFSAALTNPGQLVDAIHAAELTDPHGQRWPRSKPHDDKAVGAIALTSNPGDLRRALTRAETLPV